MAFNFPSNPNPGDEFTPPGGPTYVWNPPRWNMKPGGGGGGTIILSGPGDPEPEVGSPGNWYVNTSTGEWWGPKSADAWEWPPTPLYRPVLQWSPQFYVNAATGSDDNDGSASTPFASIAHAVAVARDYDLRLNTYIYIADGTYTDPVMVRGPQVGQGMLSLVGNGSNVVLDTMGGTALTVWDASVSVSNISFGAASGEPNILVRGGRLVTTGNIGITNVVDTGIVVTDGGYLDLRYRQIAVTGHDTITQCLIRASGNSTVHLDYVQFQFSGSPTFNLALVHACDSSYVTAEFISATGTVTAPRFFCETGGGIRTNQNPTRPNFPGSAPGVLLGTGYYDNQTAVREQLTANRIYYVDQALGNDSNTGLFPNQAFKSITRAVDVVWCTIDTGYWTATIQIAAGTHTENVVVGGRHVGLRPVVFQGAGVGNTIWAANGRTLYCQKGAVVVVQNLEIRSTGDSGLLAEDTGTVITVGQGMRFGFCTSVHMWAYGGGKITSRVGAAGYVISGNSNVHWRCDTASVIDIIAATITISAAVTINYFANSNSRCLIACNANTFVNPGNVTGSKFLINPGGQIDSQGQPQTYLPGTTAGLVQPNGIWS
ncbi:MAG: hypothetical protein ABWY64_19465 [Tardiphaga sp.]